MTDFDSAGNGADTTILNNIAADETPVQDTESEQSAPNAENGEPVWPWDVSSSGTAQPDAPAASFSDTPQPVIPDAASSDAAQPETPEQNAFDSWQPSTSYGTGSKGKPHLEINWDSKDFNTEEKRKTQDIKFDWGSLFPGGEKKEPEPAREPESGPEAEESEEEPPAREYEPVFAREFERIIAPDEPESEQPPKPTAPWHGAPFVNFYADEHEDSVREDEADEPARINETDFDFSFAPTKQTDKALDDRTKQYATPKRPAIEPPQVFSAPELFPAPELFERPEPLSAPEASGIADAAVTDVAEPSGTAEPLGTPQPGDPLQELYEEYKAATDEQEAEPSEAPGPFATPEFSTPSPGVAAPPPPPAKSFTAADIASLGIFDTEVASPFDTAPPNGGVVSPFDFSDTGIASIFGPPSAIGKPKEEPGADAAGAREPAEAEDDNAEEQARAAAEAEAEKKAQEEAQKLKVQDFLNKPVIFPFDEDTGYVEPEPGEMRFDEPEDEVVTYTEPADEEPADNEPGSDDTAAGTDNDEAEAGSADGRDFEKDAAIAAAGTVAAAAFAETAETGASAKEEKKDKKSRKDKSGKDEEESEAEAGGEDGKKRKALVICIDILIVLAVLAAAGFAILKFAPGTGAAHLLNTGIEKVSDVLGIGGENDEDSEVSEDVTNADSPEMSSDGTEIIPPQVDKNALVDAQAAFFNKNIAEAVYDESAKFDPNRTYTMGGLRNAKPIENDYWTSDAQGSILYDEAAVATIIRYNSALVSYTGGQQSDILAEVETGSPAENALADYAASLSSALAFKRLGIGEILTDGTYFYVFTNENVVETKNGTTAEVTSSKVYKLAPATESSTMRIVEIEKLT
ncbi:MAG: hypothetical protein LBC58_02175 [Clostridiales Family XIII bacterium]|jgi:hypothetical protein|nr:hypothetical protein [Clostridiales Family XIII bacterium]